MWCRREAESAAILDLEQTTHGGKLPAPFRVRAVPPQHCFHVGSSARAQWVDLGHGATPSHHDVSLSIVLDGVEEIGEVSRSIGSGNFRHRIRLSDPEGWLLPWNALTGSTGPATPPVTIGRGCPLAGRRSGQRGTSGAH